MKTRHASGQCPQTLWFRSSGAQFEALNRAAVLEGVSRAEVLRRAIELYDATSIEVRAKTLAIYRAVRNEVPK
jgi:hypothetical protein